jgi:Domain of unknown function (DUF4296)
MKAFLATIVLLSMIGCRGKDGFPGLLDKEKMQAVMWDIIQADVYTEQFIKKDSSKKASLENMQLQNQIFALHKVTRADFYKSYDYYVSHSEGMKAILDSMSAKAERERAKTIQRHYVTPKKEL